MADKQKSSLPDLGEVGAMAGKLFKDIKKSVCEIVDDYKTKRHEDSNKPADKPKDSSN